MSKQVLGVAVLAAVLAMAGVASAFSISSSQDLSAGGNIVGDGAGNTIVREGVSLTWDWGDVNGDGTRTDPVATAGLDVQSYKVHTGNTSAVDLLLNLNGGNITGQGVWNATPYHASFSAAYRMPARYEAISTQHSANYEPPPTGDIIIKNVGDISCGAITTHTIWWYGSKSAAAGAIRIGEASGTGDGPAGNIRVDALDAQCDKQKNSGGITVYSTGFIKIQDGDNDATANLGVASTAVLSYEGRDMYYYHEGAFRAGELRANTGTSTYGTTQNGGTIYLDGDYDADGGVTTALGDCLINKIDNAYKRNGYGDPNEHVTIQNYASVTLGDVITYNASSRYSDNHGGNVKVLGVAGDITIGGAIDAHATHTSANAGIVELYTTASSGGSVALDGGLDCDLVRYVAMDSDSGTSTIGGSLLGFDTVTRIKLRTPSGDVIKYDPFDGGNAYLGVLSYVVADLGGTAGAGGTLIPDVVSRTWDGGTSGTWDADGFDDSGADAPTTAAEMAKFESGATTNTVSVAAGSGAGPVAGIVRIDGGSAYTFSDSGGAVGLGASGGTAYIIVADTGAAHVIDANVTLNCGTYIDMQQAGGTLAVNGDISGSQTLTKIGSGTVTLSGSNSHSATVVDAGTLVCGAVGTLPSGGAVTVNGGTLDLGANSQSGTGSVTLAGGTITASGAVDLGSRAVTLNSGTVAGAGSVSTTGGYTASSGTVTLNGTTAGSALTVSGTGVVRGTGSASGGLVVQGGGTLSPGLSVGALNGVNATWDTGGVYDWEIDHATAGAGTGWDLLNLSGTLDIAATSADPFTVNLFTVGSLGGSHPADSGDMANFDKDSSHSWKIASAAGGVTGFDADDFVLDYREFRNAYDGNLMAGFGIRQDGNDVYVDYTPQKLLDIRIDFSAAKEPGGTDTWNVLSSRTTGTIKDLVTTDGSATDLKLEITNGFASAGTGDGWSGNNVPFWLPWNASDDQFYEGSTGHVGEITITGLTPGLTYYFELIASMDGMTYWRADYLLNDEFSIDGNSDDFYNDTEGHRDHDIMLWTFVADGSGQAVLEMTVRSYVSGMNALRITIEPPALPPIPEPAVLSLLGLALLGLRRKRS